MVAMKGNQRTFSGCYKPFPCDKISQTNILKIFFEQNRDVDYTCFTAFGTRFRISVEKYLLLFDIWECQMSVVLVLEFGP